MITVPLKEREKKALLYTPTASADLFCTAAAVMAGGGVQWLVVIKYQIRHIVRLCNQIKRG